MAALAGGLALGLVYQRLGGSAAFWASAVAGLALCLGWAVAALARLGGRLAGLSSGRAFALGAGLNGRGIMKLVIANIALSKGFIGPGLFSIVVLVGVVTTVAAPLILKAALRRGAEFGQRLPAAAGGA